MKVHFGCFLIFAFLVVNSDVTTSGDSEQNGVLLIKNKQFLEMMEANKKDLFLMLQHSKKNVNEIIKTSENNSKDLRETIADAISKIFCLNSFEEMNKWKREIEQKIADLTENKKPNNCDDLFKMGKRNSGTSIIYPFSVPNFVAAHCEYIVEAKYRGGWTVIQRRDNVTVRENFKRSWNNYVAGFGSPEAEYWIGLKAIHALTNSQPMQLQIILEDWEYKTETVNYNIFRIEDELNKFTIHVGGFSGNITDNMANLNAMDFSTFDSDNDHDQVSNCAFKYNGGWWYTTVGDCYQTNLNGLTYPADKRAWGGIDWIGFNPKQRMHPLRKVVMMIKPRDFE